MRERGSSGGRLTRVRQFGTERIREERGFAVPMVLLAIVAAFGLASAAVLASLSAQTGSTRDQRTKTALAAAEAGVANALLRYNRTAVLGSGSLCSPIGGSLVGTGGWCSNQVTGVVDRGTYTYRVKPAMTEIEVVATGAVDGVTRRIFVQAQSAQSMEQGLKPFQNASVIANDGIYLGGGATIKADVETNGNIGLNDGSVLECDYAGVGAGKGFNPNPGGAIKTCSPTETEVALPPVNPGDVATNNSNHRICDLDPLTGKKCTTEHWDPDTKRLNLKPGAALNLGSGGGEFNYAFCKITMDANSYLHIAGGATVRLYFLAPEVCDGERSPLELHSGSKIQATGHGPHDVALLVVGSETIPTNITFNAGGVLFGCDQSFVLYAPRTTLSLNSDSHICGGLAAKSVTLASNTSITASSTAADFELPNAASQYYTGYAPGTFVECAASPPAAESPPDEGC